MNGIDIVLGSTTSIRVVNSKTGEYKEFQGHNLATKQMLLGLFNFLRRNFLLPENPTNAQIKNVTETIRSYCPFFLRVGAGTTNASFTDDSLEYPLYTDGTVNDSPKPYTQGTEVWYKQYDAAEYAEEVSESVTLRLKFYIPSDVLAGTSSIPTEINEWALYSEGSGDHKENGYLLSRFVPKDENQDPITVYKGEFDFIDVLWEITLHSYVQAVEAENP